MNQAGIDREAPIKAVRERDILGVIAIAAAAVSLL
jgi:hypothetical protein